MSHSSMAGEHRYDYCCKLTEATSFIMCMLTNGTIVYLVLYFANILNNKLDLTLWAQSALQLAHILFIICSYKKTQDDRAYLVNSYDQAHKL